MKSNQKQSRNINTFWIHEQNFVFKCILPLSGLFCISQAYSKSLFVKFKTLFVVVALCFFLCYSSLSYESGTRSFCMDLWKSAFNRAYFQLNFFFCLKTCFHVPKSLLFGRISVPSSAIHASTYTKSATNDGKLHFKIAAFPRKTNSSITRVW